MWEEAFLRFRSSFLFTMYSALIGNILNLFLSVKYVLTVTITGDYPSYSHLDLLILSPLPR